MTPLAHRIALELTLPKAQRTFNDHAGLLTRFDDVHCFEATNILASAYTLGDDMLRRPVDLGRLAFLPAQKTWIEFREGGSRCGLMLTEIRDPDGLPFMASVTSVGESTKGDIGSWDAGTLFLTDRASISAPISWGGSTAADQRKFAACTYAILAMINTPRVIGRKQHMPHAGLQRAIAKSKGMVGKFPLNAWTEIELKVTPPDYQGDGEPHEAYLTGAKALHFCRAHLRIRFGRLELVSAHWRGDPALGIKQSRYRLIA